MKHVKLIPENTPDLWSMESGDTVTLTTQDMILIAMFTSLMAVGAFIRIETPLVPITLQFAFAAYAGVILGAKKGTLALALYVVIGLMGFPVFTRGGGPFYVLEPTFGYLMGMVVAAFVTGKLAGSIEYLKPRLLLIRLTIAVTIGLMIVYATGMFYLHFIMNTVMETPMDIRAAFVAGVLPFAVADIIMGAIVVVSATKIMPVLKENRLMRRH